MARFEGEVLVSGRPYRTFLYFGKSKIHVIKYKESLIIKLLYWPTILGLQLLITIVVFY